MHVRRALSVYTTLPVASSTYVIRYMAGGGV